MSFFALEPIVEARFRAATKKPPFSLVRKRCACGRIVTAKQLAQFKCCESCRKKGIAAPVAAHADVPSEVEADVRADMRTDAASSARSGATT